MLRAAALILFLAPALVAAPPAVGDKAKDFELKGIDGKPVKLSAETAKGPVALVVLRGFPGYQCPLCTRQVTELLGKAKAFEAKGARLLFVYPGDASDLEKYARDFFGDKTPPANVVFVTDPDYTFTNAYQLRWNAKNETAYPSTFVVGGDGVVKYAVVSKSHGGRAKTDEVLKAIPAR